MATDRKRLKRWARRALIAVIAVEAAWLLGVNLALSLAITQDWLNTLRPERVQFAWQRAWSLYPGHVEARGIRVSGQSPRQQWQAEAERAHARVSLLPLVLRRVNVSGGYVENARYRQRPRLEPGQQANEGSAWFPEIDGYEPSEQGEYPPPRPPWIVTVDDARLAGRHHLWIQRVQAEFDASATVQVDTRSQGGPLALAVESIDLRLDRAWADEDADILDAGAVSGSYRLGPYRYREHRGLQSLRFTDLDLDLSLQTRSLEFVRLFLLRYPKLGAGGQGDAEGHLALRAGRVVDGTDLRIEATDLVVAQAPFAATGRGRVLIGAESGGDLPFSVDFRFDELAVVHDDDREPFFTGNGLHMSIEDDGDLVPHADDEKKPVTPYRARLEVPDAVVNDMRTFNRYLPPSSPLVFTGGSADLTANLEFSPDDASGEFRLAGDALRADLGGQDLGLALRMEGVVAGGRPSEQRFDLAGSVLTLDEARVVGEATRFEDTNWSAQARFNQADLVFKRPIALELATDLAISDTRPLEALFVNHGGPAWVARRLAQQNVTGAARLRLDNQRLYIPDAHLTAEDLDVNMRGVIRDPAHEGMIYLRYKRLDALLSFEEDETHMTVFSPLEKFEAYRVELPVTD